MVARVTNLAQYSKFSILICTESKEWPWSRLCLSWLYRGFSYLMCHQWRQSWHHDNSLFSVVYSLCILLVDFGNFAWNQIADLARRTVCDMMNTVIHITSFQTSVIRDASSPLASNSVTSDWYRCHGLPCSEWEEVERLMAKINVNVSYDLTVSSGMMTSGHGQSSPITDPLCGESTSAFPAQRASDVEL